MYVFEVMTNNVQDDGACGNYTGTPEDFNLIIMNDENPKIFRFCF